MNEAPEVARLQELDDRIEKVYERLDHAQPNTPVFKDILREIDELKAEKKSERDSLRQQIWRPTLSPEEQAELDAANEQVQREVAEAIAQRGIGWSAEQSQRPAEKGREHTAPSPRQRPPAEAPIKSKDDVIPVLLEVLKQALTAPLSERDRRVLTLLFETGVKFNSTQVLCSREWMAKETGLSQKQCRLALPSLERLGWVTRLPNGPTIRWLRARWLAMPNRRRPVVVELRQRPWAQRDLDFMAENTSTGAIERELSELLEQGQ